MNQTHSYFHTLVQNMQINKVILKDAPCYKYSKEGFGPLLRFEDGSVKYDLSSNFNIDPFGKNYPKILKIKLSENYDILPNSEEMKLVADKLFNIYSNHYFLNHSESTELLMTENITAYNCLTITKSMPSLPLKSHQVYSFLAVAEFINEFYYEQESNIFKARKLLEVKLSHLKKYHPFSYDLGALNQVDLDRMNHLGLYIEGSRIFFPMSLSVEELNYILEIISK